MDKTERALNDISEQLKEIGRTLNKVAKVEAALSQAIMQYMLADPEIRTHAYVDDAGSADRSNAEEGTEEQT